MKDYHDFVVHMNHQGMRGVVVYMDGQKLKAVRDVKISMPFNEVPEITITFVPGSITKQEDSENGT